MLSNKNIHYLYKFPKLSEYGVKLFSPIFMLAVILMAMVYYNNLKEISEDSLMQIILFPPALYLSVTILNMIFNIDILIRSIINVCHENLNLSKEGDIYKNSLLVCENKNKQYIYDKKIPFALIIITTSFFLSKLLMINIQYIKCGLGLILTIIFFIRLRDISRFFYDLANSCYQIIIKNDKFSETLSGKDIINWKAFEYKWRKLLTLNIVLFLLVIVIFFIFKDFRGTISSFSLLIAAIITFKMAVDVDNIVKLNLAIMGEYDEYIKNKLGMTFSPLEIIPQGLLANINSPEQLSFPTFKKASEKINTVLNKIFRK
jgi:hypothetical protein